MEEKKSISLAGELFSWLQTFVVGLVVIVLLFTFVFRPVLVDGRSMVPTLNHKDVMLVRVAGYQPRQGDVVVLTKQFEDVAGPIVKRVVAVGGQTVVIDYAAGTLSVDGEVLDESYILEPMTQQFWQTISTITVPEGSVFVLGDNRNVSNDSRNPALGAVDERYVLGKVMVVAYPFSNFGAVS